MILSRITKPGEMFFDADPTRLQVGVINHMKKNLMLVCGLVVLIGVFVVPNVHLHQSVADTDTVVEIAETDRTETISEVAGFRVYTGNISISDEVFTKTLERATKLYSPVIIRLPEPVLSEKSTGKVVLTLSAEQVRSLADGFGPNSPALVLEPVGAEIKLLAQQFGGSPTAMNVSFSILPLSKEMAQERLNSVADNRRDYVAYGGYEITVTPFEQMTMTSAPQVRLKLPVPTVSREVLSDIEVMALYQSGQSAQLESAIEYGANNQPLVLRVAASELGTFVYFVDSAH